MILIICLLFLTALISCACLITHFSEAKKELRQYQIIYKNLLMDILTIHNLDKIEAIYLAQGWAIVEKDTAFLQFEKLDRGTQFRCFIVKNDDDETLNVSHVIGNIAFNGDCSTIGFNTQLADIEYQRRILVNKDFLQTCKKVAIGYVPTFYYERPRICVRCNIERSLPNPKISYCQPCIQDIADNLFK